MGGLTQFIWNNSTSRQSSAPTSTPTNPFAVLSSLIDKNNTDRERDRERSGPRNKGSYNKGSIERDRYDRGNNTKKINIKANNYTFPYNKKGITSRTGSSQGSRENSSSRSGQQVRSLINTSVQKSSSQTKYPQQPPPLRQAGKVSMKQVQLKV